ncbi:putative Ras-related protein Rap-1 [Paratrimastix pyriformis]|uniref:Ras-related protein Rap-1 n=1 Tax=Paratrimastix pyriformis TaxID=342808 RepID=A0ABQ8UHZ1_9EUKA|nr:putative Ras-related protein Rap-1 [Paratrimastix pyriformis]|eukprot:GAFH01004502.1.p2 GENE.GAFH01004502.1~~GAFH01004502.1.p2  ORF type:complete len:185 (+),score=49.89 GAFH01004502.1:15-569(+)
MNYKITVLGSGAVGKSSIVVRYSRGSFTDIYDPTIEDMCTKQDEFDGKACVLEILDTAGQEEYSTMREQYMQSGQGFILVYTITSAQSLDTLREMRNKIYSVKQKPDTCMIPMVVVGNKTDLEDERAVSTEDGKKFAESIHAGFIECSAKANLKIRDVFEEIIRRVNNSEFRPQPPKKKACTIL